MPNRIKYIRAPGIPKTPIGEEPGFTLPEGGQSGQALLSDGADGAEWGTIKVDIDPTLSIEGAAADAKVTGNEIGDLKSAIVNYSELYVDGETVISPKYLNKNSSGGKPTTNSNIRLISEPITMPHKSTGTITKSAGTSVVVHRFDETDTLINSIYAGASGAETHFDRCDHIRVAMQYSNNDPITPNDGLTIATVKFYYTNPIEDDVVGDVTTISYTSSSVAQMDVCNTRYTKAGVKVCFDMYNISTPTHGTSAFNGAFMKNGDNTLYHLFALTSGSPQYEIVLDDDYDFVRLYRNDSDVNCDIDIFTKLGVLHDINELSGIIYSDVTTIQYTSSSRPMQRYDNPEMFSTGKTLYVNADNFSQSTTNVHAFQAALMKNGDSTFYHLMDINSNSTHYTILLEDDYDYFQAYRNEVAVNCDIKIANNIGIAEQVEACFDEIEGVKRTSISTESDMQSKYFKSIMKVGVIGDSLSTGHIENGHSQTANTIIYGWPRQIMQETQGVWQNYGFSGATTRSWLSSASGWAALSNSGKCQIYVIGLGVNDSAGSSTPPAVTLGTISDIHQDYTENTDTFFGNYGKIISKVHEYAPEAKFILLTSPRLYNATYTPQFNQAIRDISELTIWGANTVFLCDLRDDYLYLFNSDAITSQQHGWHYTAEGYAAIAKMMEIAISDVMKNNSAFALIDEVEYETDT